MRRSLNSLLHARRLYLIAKEDQRQGESDYAEFACSVAFKVCADAMEQALAGRLYEVLGKSYKEELGEKPRFDKLLDKFKVAIKPSLPGELEKALLGCREIRNDMTHHAQLPAPEEVEESFEVARTAFALSWKDIR